MTQSIEERRKEFEQVALQYMDVLYRAALGMTRGNEADAQDLVQDTYLRAYQFFDKFNKGTNFKGWVLKILWNVFINKYRARAKMPEMVSISKAEFSGELRGSTTPEDEIFSKLFDFDDEVTAAMNALPEAWRLAVILADLEGFKYREIAEILDWPLGTVLSRIHRGRNSLRMSLGEYGKKHGY